MSLITKRRLISGERSSRSVVVSPIGNIALNVSKKSRPSFQTEACKNEIILLRVIYM